jgi:hypothetical protein
MDVHACSCWCIRMAQYYYCCSCWAVDGRLVCWAFMFFRFREWLIGAGCVGNLQDASRTLCGAWKQSPHLSRYHGYDQIDIRGDT